MKAILEFNLDNPDDRIAHLRAAKSLDMACVLFEIERNLKKKLEYKVESLGDIDNQTVVDILFEEINDLMKDNNINLEEIIQ